MAVLTPDGVMATYVVEVTERYAVAVSILNTAFRASGKPRGTTISRFDLLERRRPRTTCR